jgi:hypothetical protein
VLVHKLERGLAVSYAMNQFQRVWSSAEERITGNRQQQEQNDDAQDANDEDGGPHLGVVAGSAVYYAFGTIMGALYGAAAEINPSTNALAGIPFGAMLFAGAAGAGTE